MATKKVVPTPARPLSPTVTSSETYLLKPREKVSIDAHLERRLRAKPFPRQIVETKGGVANLTDDHPDKAVGASLTMEALGLTRVGELTSVLQNVVELTQRDRKADEHAVNEMFAQIAAVQPTDGVEAMLAVQMVAVHRSAMKAARALRGSETIPQQDSNSNALNKLTRTFVSQIEALKRYRSKGEQKVIVEHVTVNEGGQAIVGQVGGGVRDEK
ncbi:MAG TPA: hypothetical protein VGN80_12455 [Devosiaceae bacterium]|jgi:hypothetical protein|nr:hypothetical protein [Devosiaceae bacterium]